MNFCEKHKWMDKCFKDDFCWPCHVNQLTASADEIERLRRVLKDVFSLTEGVGLVVGLDAYAICLVDIRHKAADALGVCPKCGGSWITHDADAGDCPMDD